MEKLTLSADAITVTITQDAPTPVEKLASPYLKELQDELVKLQTSLTKANQFVTATTNQINNLQVKIKLLTDGGVKIPVIS